ncbi:hypothetical protein SAMN05216554_3542 [Herbiconiux ginsengi]|uniref:Uncharacterized protein n=1 Tax=Herbiconiux ginsengi TaxID=381665 RepID=A0A1H3SPN5_9MICO|nr:hypothetical protein SAMN05216554_3542 [Herbiconiux ginsengi]
MLGLVAAIFGGLLAMHSMSADHGLDSSMIGMGHENQVVASSATAQSDQAGLHISPSMAMLACILALLTADAIAAASPPSPVRPLDLPETRLLVHLRSPGWGFSLPPPSLVVLSISRT